jgi:predicted transglutaminase-like cysteine proteinase
MISGNWSHEMSVWSHAVSKFCGVARHVTALATIAVLFSAHAQANTAAKFDTQQVSGHHIVGGEFALAPFAHVVFCHTYQEQCRITRRSIRKSKVRLTPERLREIGSVNKRVNASIRAVPDAPGPLGDRWTLSPARGDCDDYAVTKRAELLKAGWPSRSLLLAAARLPDGQEHLVLIIRTTSGDVVADNLSPVIRPLHAIRYQWTMVQDEANPRFWRRTNPGNMLLAIVNPLGSSEKASGNGAPAGPGHVIASNAAWNLRGSTYE